MGHRLNEQPAEYEQIHRALLAGLLSQVGLLSERHEYSGAHGKRFHIFPGSSLFKQTPKWIMAAELVQTTRLYARTVAKINPAWIEPLAEHLIRKSQSEPRWDGRRARVVADEKVTLFGLTVIPRRTVHYGPIDPAKSRELFIHHALVEQDYATRARFFKANAELIEDVRKLEAKTRTRDILVDPETLYAFYDRRLPGDAYNGSRFERWRKEAEASDPTLLHMTREDVLNRTPREITPESYPDTMQVGQTSARLTYKLDPGAPDDGVTLNVPVEALDDLTEERCEWIVPGLLREKIIALIRSLPKAIRTNFVPVPEYADACLSMLRPGDISLIDAVADALGKLAGVPIPRDAWQVEQLPDHLHMKLNVLDPAGAAIADGKDLAEIREQVRQRLQDRIASLPKQPIERTGITDWDFDELPETHIVVHDGAAVATCPALVDRGDAVAITLVSDADEADRISRAGLRRLMLLQAGRELTFQIEHLPSIDRMALHYAEFGGRHALVRDLTDLVADRVFLGDDEIIRTEQAFRRKLDHGWDAMGSAAHEVGRLIDEILQARQALAVQLAEPDTPATRGAIGDLRAQLDGLFPSRFMIDTPSCWLVQYPRYLRAAQRRLEKIRTGHLDRDRVRFEQLAPLIARLDEARKAQPDRPDTPELVQYRWMLEEFRVSLFAQELGTAIPISAKRLERQWKKIRREGAIAD
jgi:ATP-dependent helicase HrpA